MSVARRLRVAIKERVDGIPVTVSIGVASYPANADDHGSLVAAADDALYNSKRKGRDRVTASRRAGAAERTASLTG